ncbi:MAG TPA: CHAD domain-containing protein [Tepidisphaeraceae bacterium]|nr:CHAD domain-containing protein [Tepidisphaeraceae bacterium]
MTMQSEPVAVPPVVQYLDGLVDQLRMHAAGVLDTGAVESVHQARVTTRRLRAASDLLRPLLKSGARDRFNHLQRKVRRRLGPIRDLDVLTALLTDFSDADSTAAAAWMLDALAPTRTDLLQTASKDKAVARLPLKLGPWYKIRAQIIDHAASIDPLLSESLHDQIDAFAARARELAEAQPGVDPHQVRIAGKSLRYTLELAAAHGHALEESLLKSFKKLQDALGTWHDFVVLAEQSLLLSAERMVAHHDIKLQRSVLALANAALTFAEGQLEKFNRLWSEHGEGLAESIRAAFPLSQPVEPVTEPKTDHDPADSTPPEIPDGPH